MTKRRISARNIMELSQGEEPRVMTLEDEEEEWEKDKSRK